MLELNYNYAKRLAVVFLIITSINATLTFRDNMDQLRTSGGENIDSLRFHMDLSTSIEFLDSLTSFDSGQTTSCDTDYIEISYINVTNATFILVVLPSLVISLGAVSKKRKWVSENSSIRERLYTTIDSNPGLHFRELCRSLNRQNGVIQYHLWILETREGRITSYQDGGYTRFFTISIENANDLYFQLFSAFRKSSMKKVLFILHSSSDGVSRQVLAEELSVSPQCISRICQKLLLSEIIEESSVNRQKLYGMTENAVSVFDKIITKCHD